MESRCHRRWAHSSPSWAARLSYREGHPGALEAYAEDVRAQFEAYLQGRRGHYAREERWPHSAFSQRRRGRITLAPWQPLRFTDGPLARRELHRAMFLSEEQLERLCQACIVPRTAHEVVSAFRAGTPAVPDLRVIEAIQHLVERGVLAALPPSGDSAALPSRPP